jgi:hypothetical protein
MLLAQARQELGDGGPSRIPEDVADHQDVHGGARSSYFATSTARVSRMTTTLM